MKPTVALTIACWLMVVGAARADDGDRVTEFTSPSGVAERCVAIAPMPGGHYSSADRAAEDAFCGIDFYANDVAICPKTWSTSPATIVHDVSAGAWANRGRDFEAEICPAGTKARNAAHRELAAYKITMNAPDTSATFSTAALLYYHFARYFDAAVHVPVAVYRSMDRQEHHDRIAVPGVRLTADKSSLKMIHAAWQHMVSDDETPGTNQPARDVFTEGRDDVFGVLLNQEGRRYSEVVNGTRESGWGDGQNRDFQRTPPFVALTTPGSLNAAIAAGRAAADGHPKFQRYVKTDTPDAQFVFWMQELTEITLLDYIFSQQDRIGNIDYIEQWYWIADGEVHHGRTRPAGNADRAIALKRTHLNDNDAGGKPRYANYAKRTGMLTGIRHYSAGTYRKLKALADDLELGGPLYHYVATRFGLDDRELAQIVDNTGAAAALLTAACEAGHLAFDLDPVAFLLGQAAAAAPACANP